MIEKFAYLPVKHKNRPGFQRIPRGLIFHTTNNWDPKATDEMHGEYMKNQTERVVSWHDTVDSDSVTHHIPYDENAWHAGDGNGVYNTYWLGMEIACNKARDDKNEAIDQITYDNAVEQAAKICYQFSFGFDQLQPHNVVYGKDCPYHLLFDRMTFKKDVFRKIEDLKKAGVKPVEKPLTKFVDVPAGHFAEKAIANLSSLGVIRGYNETTYKPDQPITRAEAAVLINTIYTLLKGVK